MNILLNLAGKLFGWDRQSAAYWDRFMQPQLDYAISLGMATDVLLDLVHRAINESDYAVTFPGSLLRDYIADWEFKNHNNPT